MGTIKATNIQTITGSGTLTLGTSGETVSVGSGVTLSGGFGVTEADQWRLNADFTMSTNGSNVLVNSNWERVDTDGFGQLGTGMTESSGVFSFPSTGIYYIQSIADILNNSGANSVNLAGLRIFTTTDNSTYDLAAGGYQPATDGHYITLTTSFVFDVTDTSTHKVGFYYRVNVNNPTLRGNSGVNESHVTFIRLGDT